MPAAAVPLLPRVRLELSDDDQMYHGNDRHYLTCGASALNVILGALALAEMPGPAAILDFGAGAGRVTRWLQAAFPEAEIQACDVREPDMRFASQVLGVPAWTTSVDLSGVAPPRHYDLVWAGSVATHLSARRCEQLLDALLSWTRPGGLVVVSLHGRYALRRQREGRFRYIDDERWQGIEAEVRATGYGYADYPGQPDYGIAVTTPSWIAAQVERRPGVRLVFVAERVWDDHHDVVAVQRRPI